MSALSLGIQQVFNMQQASVSDRILGKMYFWPDLMWLLLCSLNFGMPQILNTVPYGHYNNFPFFMAVLTKQ